MMINLSKLARTRITTITRAVTRAAATTTQRRSYLIFRKSVNASVLLTATPLLISALGTVSSTISAPLSSSLSSTSSPLLRESSLTDAIHTFSENANDIIINVKSSITDTLNSEGGRTIMLITGINTAVYLLWKVAPTPFMIKHFSNSLSSLKNARFWTSFTSNFSHMSFFHLAANMYLLNRFGHDVAEILGMERFSIFYCTAGVASSLASLAFRRFTKSNVISLGASGAVVATLWAHACFFPDRRMVLIGTEKSLSMQELVLLYAVFDAAGLLGSFGKIDFAAHLGGAFFANLWFHLVRDKLVEDYISQQSHFRNPFRTIIKHYSDDERNSKSR